MKNYTFETFVTADCNRLAYEVCKIVSEAPGKVYNPLFIYSQPGLGKTHLLKAIQQHMERYSPEKRVVYVTLEEWMHDLLDSLRSRKRRDMDLFKAKYRDLDMLLVDDIQFLAGKEYSQEEFMCTMKELEIKQKGIVISSDVPPKKLPRMDEILKCMFIGGIIAEIEPPDYQARLSILRKLQEQYSDVTFEEEGLEFIATNIYSDVRALEGALQILYSWIKVNGAVEKGSLDYEKVLADYVRWRTKR